MEEFLIEKKMAQLKSLISTFGEYLMYKNERKLRLEMIEDMI